MTGRGKGRWSGPKRVIDDEVHRAKIVVEETVGD